MPIVLRPFTHNRIKGETRQVGHAPALASEIGNPVLYICYGVRAFDAG